MVDVATRDAPNPTAFRMKEAYRWVREVVADLSEEQLRWQPNPTTPSIRFHLFHIARCADDLHTAADRSRPAGLACGGSRHPLGPRRRLGLVWGESGAMVDDTMAMVLPLPGCERRCWATVTVFSW